MPTDTIRPRFRFLAGSTSLVGATKVQFTLRFFFAKMARVNCQAHLLFAYQRSIERDLGKPIKVNMYRKKTFREKLADSKDFPRVETITKGMRKRFGAGTIVLPAPYEVDGLMKKVPKGKLITINQIRETLARRHGATMACPIVTGILARISAGAAGEEEADGRKRITPYWRTLKTGGELNQKYPGGIEGQKERLESEGHTVINRGKRWFVQDHTRCLVKPEWPSRRR